MLCSNGMMTCGVGQLNSGMAYLLYDNQLVMQMAFKNNIIKKENLSGLLTAPTR